MSRSRLLKNLIPLLAVLIYWAALWAIGGFRKDHLTTGFLILALSYLGARVRKVRKFLMPFLLTAIIYDSMRFYADYLRGPIHVREPYDFDKYFFGIHTSTGILTPNEWFQLHTHPILDLITGFFYLVFFSIYIGIAAYFYFYVSQTGTDKVPAARAAAVAPAVNWSFLWLNLLGYSTYYWYAAAPPWYVAGYGLGPARNDVAASSAGCVRFDQLLGTHFFSEMYGRAADIYGAIPSLHVAYPFLAIIFSFYFARLRVFSILFYLVMCFSAVYLNHHYILDIIWGSSYALIVALVTIRVLERRMDRTRHG